MENLLKEFNKEDEELFLEEFEGFLPDSIFDFHVHLWKKSFIIKKIPEGRLKSNPFLDSDINEFKIEDFKKIAERLFPGKNYEALILGIPLREADFNQNNAYISQCCDENDFDGLFLSAIDQNIIPDDFFINRFIGFKPYPDLVAFEAPKDFSKLDINVSIFDFISKKVLEFSQEHKLIILLHIPRKKRLNDQDNIKEITQIAKIYPDIKLILAHAGRSYCYSDIKDSIKHFKDFQNIYVDTAMINSYSVNKVILEELGPKRMLYGSDLAVAILKGKNIDINNRHYFVTNKPRVWSLSSNDMNLDSFTFFIYEIIRSIRIACKSLNLNEKDVKDIFYGNAKRLIEDIKSYNNAKVKI